MIAVLFMAQLALSGASDNRLDFKVDECTHAGQQRIKNRLLALFQEAELETKEPILDVDLKDQGTAHAPDGSHVEEDAGHEAAALPAGLYDPSKPDVNPNEGVRLPDWTPGGFSYNDPEPLGKAQENKYGDASGGVKGNNMWPVDLEDPEHPMAAELDQLDETARWQKIQLMKAFDPVYWMDTLLKEQRDNNFCNVKRMECMSVDDIGLPIESMMGTRAWFAMYDSLPPAQQKMADVSVTAMRAFVVEPLMNSYYRLFVYPSKTLVEAMQVPKGYPGLPESSAPAKNPDFEAKETYEAGAFAPAGYQGTGDDDASVKVGSPRWTMDPNPGGGPMAGLKLHQKQGESTPRWLIALQTHESGRKQCDNIENKVKGMICHLDFMVNLFKIGNGLIKEGKLREFTPEEGDAFLQYLDDADAKYGDVQKDAMAKCAKDRGL